MIAAGTVFGIISIGLAFASYYPYYRDIFRGTTKPHVMTWFTWGLVTAIAFFGQLSDGAGFGAWTTGMLSVACLGIAGLALRYGEKNITRGDWISFIAALAAIPLWLITDDALLAVVWAALIDCFACWPTIRKTWAKPHEETLSSYAIAGVRSLFSILALENFTATTVVYPLVIAALDFIVVAIIIGRKQTLKTA